MIVDNLVAGPATGMGVLACGVTCSAEQGKNCVSASSDGVFRGCANNGTSDIGRDCTPLRDSGIGSFTGAINQQLAWRRNTMDQLILNDAQGGYAHFPVQPFVTLDGAVFEHNHQANGTATAVANTQLSANLVMR